MIDKDFEKQIEEFDTKETKSILVDEYVDLFVDFYEEVYKKEIEEFASNYPSKKSFEIDYKKLEDFDLNLAERLLSSPHIIFEAANAAIRRLDLGILDSEIEKNFSPIVRFFNLPEEYRISIRDVGSDHLSHLVSVEGTIRVITEKLEKLTSAYFICRKCSSSIIIYQKTQQLTKPIMCNECKSREFDLDLEQSSFIDYQKIEIQEPLESLKGSDQASNIDIFLSDDLVNKCSAGDKIIVTGTLKLRPPKGDSNIYSRYLVANHIEKIDQEYEELKISFEEEQEIKEYAKKENIYEMLSKSVAPNIYGHDVVKEAITLQMFGGVKKEIAKQRTRGNIHVLLVGDPSTGKSKLLEYANTLAPKSIYVAGKTVSGAGLTVSAVKDEYGEGGWTLKAGAIILASGGIAMIDEFDKIGVDDRSSLHEAMAQSTVSVSKAGLYSKFRADTSVLAAANPKHNRFDTYKNPLEQIDLPFSLLSRFDLYFVIPDVLDRQRDSEIATHVLKTHTLAEKLHNKSKTITKQELEDLEKQILPIIDPNLFKKYVAYARQNIRPVLSEEASKIILKYYVDLRDVGRKNRVFTATPRQLEGFIRLSEASAKIKLRSVIEAGDAERAIRIFKTSFEQVALDKETGNIDIDILQTGQSQSERNFIKAILKHLKILTQEKPISVKEFIEFTTAEKLDKERVFDAIGKLKRIGDIYEPKPGLLKATEPESF